MNSQAADPLLARVRKLLAKAEDAGVTAAEAQALTAKAAELMAKYGIDRALLAAERPETDRPADRVIDVGNPWARVQAHLLCGLASALRCQCVILPRPGPGSRIHVFGYSSDIDDPVGRAVGLGPLGGEQRAVDAVLRHQLRRLGGQGLRFGRGDAGVLGLGQQLAHAGEQRVRYGIHAESSVPGGWRWQV